MYEMLMSQPLWEKSKNVKLVVQTNVRQSDGIIVLEI